MTITRKSNDVCSYGLLLCIQVRSVEVANGYRHSENGIELTSIDNDRLYCVLIFAAISILLKGSIVMLSV